jgi:glucose-1-phosphate cytidylyltransferase
MIPIGYRPILWHIMKYYAHHGHRDFTLCLGYKADVVKQYFLDYNEALSNDFVLDGNGGAEPARVELLGSDIHDWRITFADTGLHANIGQRLVAVRRHVEGEEVFLANYGDVLTDAPLPELVDDFVHRDAVAAFMAVKPTYTFHVVTSRDDGLVERIDDVRVSDIWINGGYFVLRQEVFDTLDYDTVVVLDSHWATTVEFVVTAQERRKGLFTSEELPRGMSQRPYDFLGDPELAQLIASKADDHGTWITAISDDHLPIFYATTNLWEFLGQGLPDKRWNSIGVCQTADTEDFLRLLHEQSITLRDLDGRGARRG